MTLRLSIDAGEGEGGDEDRESPAFVAHGSTLEGTGRPSPEHECARTGFASNCPNLTSKMSNMARWMSGAAKQQFSELVRRSAKEPQEIYRRDRLVAAVISAEDFEEFKLWREAQEQRTLGQAFAEVRELAARYDYELDTGERRDREGWPGEPT